MKRVLLLFCLFASSIFAEDRIAGGRDAPEEDLSSVVRITGDTSICTGTIISPHHVLTTAHCVRAIGDGKIHSHAGHGYYYRMTYEHPEYSVLTKANDIGIIYVVRAMIEKPMPLLSFPVEPETVVMLAGYGMTKATIENGKITPNEAYLPKKLQVGFATTLEKSRCRLFYQFPKVDGYCVGYFNSGPLPGDSGGPLIVKSKSGEALSIGIASFGHPASMKYDKNPYIYTRVSPYCDWIEQVSSVKCVEAQVLKLIPLKGPV